jgi:hypothetical protein
LVGGSSRTDDYRLELFVTVPWGDGPGAIPIALRDHPPFGEMSMEQMRKVRAPVRIRLGARGGLHILPVEGSGHSAGFIYHVDASGDLVGRTRIDRGELSSEDDSTTVDYVVDGKGDCYLLEQLRLQNPIRMRNRLRKLSATGNVLWSREGPSTDDSFDVGELKGNFQRLWMDEDSRLLLPATEHAGVIAEIDPETGAVSRLHASAIFSRIAFLGARDQVVYVLYFPDIDRRGIGVFDIGSQNLTRVVGDPELYRWLVFPFGADGKSNLYAWRDSMIARIAPDGRIDVLGALENIAVGPTGDIVYSSLLRSKEAGVSALHVTSHERHGQTSDCELSLPETTGQSPGEWKLIHIDERQRYYVFGGEEPGKAGTLLIYSDQGVLVETLSPPPELLRFESTLERPSFWDVDRHGRIYMPVVDSQGLKVIRFTEA